MIHLPELLVVCYCNMQTILHGPSNSDTAEMNHQLELISQWTLTNEMRLSYSKSSVMWFRVSNRHQSPDPPATLLEGVPLNVVSK